MNLYLFPTVNARKALAAICLLIFCGMAAAAFWPFNPFPANHVSWLGDEKGLRFGGGGIIWSSGKLEFPESETPPGVSLEIWLAPSQDRVSTGLLSFSSRANPNQFRLRQAQSYLLLLEEPIPTVHHSATLWVPRAFQAHKRKFVTISSGMAGTTVYLDGLPAEKSSGFRITRKDLSARLVVGCSPDGDDAWRGELFGIAIFDREITPVEVTRHYQAWLNGQSATLRNDHPLSLYAFEEHAARIVRNQISSGPDLDIPKSFGIPYKPFLRAPWKEFYPHQAYLKDVFINIAGFLPFGFFFCMYLSAGKVSRKTVVATIILGAAFSTTIEVLQWFIPVRDSGTTDILTNTLGTALGATLCRSAVPSTLLGRWGSQPAS